MSKSEIALRLLARPDHPLSRTRRTVELTPEQLRAMGLPVHKKDQ